MGHLTLRGVGDDGRSGDCTDSAAGPVSTPVSVVGVRGSGKHVSVKMKDPII